MKRGIMFKLFGIVFLIAMQAKCDSARAETTAVANSLSAVIHAKSTTALRAVLENERNGARARRACEIQLRDKLIPTSCFGIEADRENLDEICIQRVRVEKTIAELENAIKAVSARCRVVADQRIGDLRYQSADRNSGPELE